MNPFIYTILARTNRTEELEAVMDCNETSAEFGLTLTQEEAGMLVEARSASLIQHHRIEFGKGILNKLIYAFCDSQYIDSSDYADILAELQDIFYLFKNEAADELTDDELISFMRDQFEQVCFGDIDYLADTCLERFSRAVRAGYRGFVKTGGRGEYEKLSEEARWDKALYMQVLTELCWR